MTRICLIWLFCLLWGVTLGHVASPGAIEVLGYRLGQFMVGKDMRGARGARLSGRLGTLSGIDLAGSEDAVREALSELRGRVLLCRLPDLVRAGVSEVLSAGGMSGLLISVAVEEDMDVLEGELALLGRANVPPTWFLRQSGVLSGVERAVRRGSNLRVEVSVAGRSDLVESSVTVSWSGEGWLLGVVTSVDASFPVAFGAPAGLVEFGSPVASVLETARVGGSLLRVGLLGGAPLGYTGVEQWSLEMENEGISELFGVVAVGGLEEGKPLIAVASEPLGKDACLLWQAREAAAAAGESLQIALAVPGPERVRPAWPHEALTGSIRHQPSFTLTTSLVPRASLFESVMDAAPGAVALPFTDLDNLNSVCANLSSSFKPPTPPKNSSSISTSQKPPSPSSNPPPFSSIGPMPATSIHSSAFPLGGLTSIASSSSHPKDIVATRAARVLSALSALVHTCSPPTNQDCRNEATAASVQAARSVDPTKTQSQAQHLSLLQASLPHQSEQMLALQDARSLQSTTPTSPLHHATINQHTQLPIWPIPLQLARALAAETNASVSFREHRLHAIQGQAPTFIYSAVRDAAPIRFEREADAPLEIAIATLAAAVAAIATIVLQQRHA